MKKEIIQRLLTLGVQLRITNGDLKVNAPKGVLTKELVEEIRLNKEYLKKLVSSNIAIPSAEIKSTYDLTPTQYFMWFTHEHLGGNKAYNIVATMQLTGKLNVNILEKAFQYVVGRHESLRTLFKKDQNGDVKQQILNSKETDIQLETIELSSFDEFKIEKEIKNTYEKVFKLEEELPLSITLLTDQGQKHILVFLMHHIIGDGWSLQLLTREVMLAYNSLVNGLPIELEKLTLQYKDYSEWLNEKISSDEYKNKLEYWKNEFQTLSPVLNLTPETRPVVKTYNGAVHNYTFPLKTIQSLKVFAQEHQMTMFMLLLGGLKGVFYKYTGQTDITVGTTVAGREHPDLENQIGLYSNAMAIRTRFEEEATFLKFLQIQKQILLQDYENKEYPFTSLVNQLTLPKDSSRSPLFDIMVLLQNHQTLEINDQKGILGIQAKEYTEIKREVSQLDMSFVFTEKDKDLSIAVEYNTDIYDQQFIVQLLLHFEQFITYGTANPHNTIKSIPILHKNEKSTILNKFNQSITPYSNTELLLHQIKEQANLYPDKEALVGEKTRVNYDCLEKYSNQLANLLEEKYQLKKGDFIGLELTRSPWTIITMLAILKTGNVYVPIDPTYPEIRKIYIQDDSNCIFKITEKSLIELKSSISDYKEDYVTKIQPEDLAYIIYTSGSTGNPKGVQISYGALSDYIITFKNYFEITSQDSIVQQASISFDTSIEEIFPILISGGTLFFHEDKTDFDALFKLCEQHNISILSTNPYVLQSLNETYDQYSLSLRVLISGGDTLKFKYIDQLYNKINIYNTYGPTESTVCATYHLVNKAENNIPIGKPITNREVYLLQPEDFQLSPIGVIGEICISGLGLSHGYLNKPELTKEKFIKNPYKVGAMLYRTGDLGYWRLDGSIVFVGRNDDQVKLRGYRIELGEIEQSLLEQPEIRKAVVLINDQNTEKTLVAYITGENVDVDNLKTKLRLQLPDYMIPNYFMVVEEIPITVNGKVDKKKLLNLQIVKTVTSNYEAPVSDLEKELVSLWQIILNVEKVGIKDNFFELGGHSLKAVKFINDLKQRGHLLTIKDLFLAPSISQIIPYLKTINNGQEITKAPELESYPVTSSQRRIWTLSQFEEGNVAYNITNVIRICGTLEIDLLQQAVDKVMANHESLRTVFKATQENLLQVILSEEAVKSNVKVYKASDENDINTIIEQHINHAFDLTKPPLLKIALIMTAEHEYLLLFNLHHIVGDGWSMEILSRELVTIYNKLKGGLKIKETPLSIQYKDYAYWSTTTRYDELSESKTFWNQKLSGELPVLELPVAKTRPKVKTHNGAKMTHEFTSQFTDSLKTKVKEQDATLFICLLAGINGLLYRYTGQTDTIIGTPVAGRNQAILENQIGLYLNTLAIRTHFGSDDTFDTLIDKQKEVLLECYTHQEYPFDLLVEELSIKRDISRSAIFDIMVVLHNQQDIFKQEGSFVNTVAEGYPLSENHSSQFDISFSFVEGQDSLKLSVTYNTDIYTAEVIQSFITYLEHFIHEGIRCPKSSIAKINYLPLLEQKRILSEINSNPIESVEEQTLLDFIQNQCTKTPDDVALICDNRTITFKTLDEKSNQLANYFINDYRVSPRDFVGIKLERTEWLIITAVAILKTGAAYVPIDINYPDDRIRYIEEDSACKFSVTKTVLEDFKQKELYDADLPKVRILPKDLAYVIYTSGSTGKPKGVMLTHANVTAFLHWCKKEFTTTDFNILYASTSHCFDLSIYEMFYPLSIGKKVRILPNGLSIDDYIKTDTIILLNTVPSVVENLLERKVSLENVSAINMAGEPIPITLSNALLEYPIVLRNLYGPSEDTTYSSCYHISKKHEKSLPIGKPINGTNFYILSEELALQGQGLIGEICISGSGLSQGYLNRPELTKEKFIKNPYKVGTMLYRTGDLGYWMPDGNIGFIGRKDHQIKLRGYRIELGEIEYALQQEENINQAVSLVKDKDGEKFIVAYVTGQEIEVERLKDTLSKKLPAYMVPSYYMILENIPLTPNGKVNRNQLLALEIIKKSTSSYLPPKTDLEKEIAEIWEEVFRVDRIGLEDNFFELGGNSLKAINMLSQIQKKYSIKVPVEKIFMYPKLGLFILEIENSQWLKQINENQSSRKIII